MDSNHTLEALVVDNSNTFHWIQSLQPIALGQWYSAAATFDGSTFSLYLKQEDGGP